jgi:hypothetical protein
LEPSRIYLYAWWLFLYFVPPHLVSFATCILLWRWSYISLQYTTGNNSKYFLSFDNWYSHICGIIYWSSLHLALVFNCLIYCQKFVLFCLPMSSLPLEDSFDLWAHVECLMDVGWVVIPFVCILYSNAKC